MQALCFGANGWWQEEELGREGNTGGVLSWPRTEGSPQLEARLAMLRGWGDRGSSTRQWTQSERQKEPQCET